MALQTIKKLLEGFISLKSQIVLPDYRLIQKEIDVSKLFLLTSYRALGSNASEQELEKVAELQRKLYFAEQYQQVQTNVHEQVRHICRALDNIFVAECDRKKALEASFKRPSGLAFAVSKRKLDLEVQKLLAPPSGAPLDKYDLNQALKSQIGFFLELKQSEIPGPLAGEGLFLDGIARTGTVVALYPGIVYSPSKYWYIPGYPKLDAASNPYLVSRYEGYVIDAKPWGRGGQQREWWDGYEEPEKEDEEEEEPQEEPKREGEPEQREVETKDIVEAAGDGGPKELVEAKEKEEEEEDDDPLPDAKLKVELIERRNPLALGHFINHPPKGQLPNVMLCPYDFPEYDEDMRPYIPNIRFEDDAEMKMERVGLKWSKVGQVETLGAKKQNPTYLRCLVLVTTRNVSNEELLLNYRLSNPNPKKKPSWYHPIDEAEDSRRWAAQ